MSASFRRGLLGLTLLGLAVRLAWLALEPATFPVADETMWLKWATEILPSPEVAFSPLALRFIFHPPLYLYFVGVPFALTGSLTAAKVLQCGVGALLVPALGLLGRRLAGERSGLLAAGIAACYPELVWFASHFWAETLFTTILWWAMERLAASDEGSSSRSSSRAAVLAGVLFGLAVLTRETVLYFLPLAALWLGWRRAGGWRRAALLLASAALVVIPWTIRNARAFGAFVPVSTAGALNLWQGNALVSRQQVYEEYWAVHGRIAKYEYARRKGIEAVLARQPFWLFDKLRAELPEFWAAHGQPIVHIERGAYGHVPRPRALAAIAVVLLPYLAVLVLFVAGLAFLPRGRLGPLLLGFLVYYVTLHVATHGYPRYRLPALPVVFLFAAHGLTALLARPRPASDRPRRLLAAAVAAVLALSLAPSLLAWATQPWPPPWFAHTDAASDGGETPAGHEAPAQEQP